MPQGRRKTPFSGKAKKEQLKLKKQRQAPARHMLLHDSGDEGPSGTVNKINYQAKKSGGLKTNKYALFFHKETDEEIRKRKEIARGALDKLDETQLEVSPLEFYPPEMDFPKRPEWSYDLTKEQLDARENRYFTEYLKKIEENHASSELSFFELNLETWRQLWRVLEMSDVILYIVDARFSALMFPPSLYEYVTKTLKKNFILVLNKIDLVPAPLVVAWKSYFEQNYPKIHIAMFTTLPGYNLIGGNQSNESGLQVRRRRGKIRMAAEGAQTLLETCKKIVGPDVDLSSWEVKIREEMNLEFEENDKVEIGRVDELKSVDTTYFEHEKYKDGILTIGCIGHPNVGKSSLMNALKGRKVVSVSKTPGHTKHFQTIFLTKNVRLCDCPGLVFPSKVPKTLQVLMGSFPIAQLREPYTSIKYLAERLNLPKLLKIDHPSNDEEWSAMDICDGWAKKRGYLTAKAARLDSYRAANSLLRMALDGKLCLTLRPPLYTSKTDYWSGHKEVQKVLWIQAKTSEHSEYFEPIKSDFEDSEEEIEEKTNSNSEDESGDVEENSDGDDDGDGDEEVEVLTNKFSVLQD